MRLSLLKMELFWRKVPMLSRMRQRLVNSNSLKFQPMSLLKMRDMLQRSRNLKITKSCDEIREFIDD